MNPTYNPIANIRVKAENMSRIKAMIFIPDDRARFPNWSLKKVALGMIGIFLGGQIAYGLLSYWGM